MIIDTHAHLYWDSIHDHVDTIVEDFRSVGGVGILNVSCDMKTYQECVTLEKRFDLCRSSIGIHPTSAHGMTQDQLRLELEAMQEYLEDPQHNPIAVGEIGFDYHWLSDDPDVRKKQLDLQHEAFFRQTKIARKYNLPVIIHTRDCMDLTLDAIAQSGLERFVVHCFSEDIEMLDRICALSSGAHVSLTCNCTYPKNKHTLDAIVARDLERVMIETDAPFLPPQRLRSRVDYNEPKNLTDTIDIFVRESGTVRGAIEEKILDTTKSFFDWTL